MKTNLDLLKSIIMDNLPTDIHFIIHQYSSSYLYEIPRWNNEIKKWRRRKFIQCYMCKRSSHDVALDHICQKCFNPNSLRPCHNLLICWDCAH